MSGKSVAMRLPDVLKYAFSSLFGEYIGELQTCTVTKDPNQKNKRKKAQRY